MENGPTPVEGHSVPNPDRGALVRPKVLRVQIIFRETIRERARAITTITHPDDRGELLRYAADLR